MNKNGVLEDFVIGNDYDIERDVTHVPDTTLVLGWFTLKKKLSDADTAALVHKRITPTAQSGIGQITDTGSDGTGIVLFQLTALETAGLLANRTYYYDITVKTSTGKTYTVEVGRVTPIPRVRLTEYS